MRSRPSGLCCVIDISRQKPRHLFEFVSSKEANMDEYEAVRAELSSNEKMIWTGRPYSGFRLRPIDALLIPISFVWAIFVSFGSVLMLIKNGPVLFLFFAAGIIVVAIYVTVGRFIHDIIRRRRIIYALTDKRILIVSGSKMKSVHLSDARSLEFKLHRDGLATVKFGPSPSIFASGGGLQRWGAWTGAPAVPTLEMIEDGERVYQEIKRLAWR